MSDLLDFVLATHGGHALWQGAGTVTASVNVHGVFWTFKGRPEAAGVKKVSADLSRQRISIHPFGPGLTVTFDALEDRVTITDAGGSAADLLAHPRASMAGFIGDSLWSPAQAGYFLSYAIWLYLTEPVVFTFPGVRTRELEPWQEDGESWRRLQVSFPPAIASHSAVQTYYFDSVTGLQRRIDYTVEVNGGAEVAHYTSEHRYFGRLPVPTRRRVLLRDEKNIADHRFAAVLLDVDDVRISG
jgi:hypothetical protein